MEHRKRVKSSKPEYYFSLSQDTPVKGRHSSDVMWKMERPNATQEGGTRKLSLPGGSGACSHSDILPLWVSRQRVSIVTGLLFAGMLAVSQAWCVNTIHENLLWFSQLTVGYMILFSFEPLINYAHCAHARKLQY